MLYIQKPQINLWRIELSFPKLSVKKRPSYERNVVLKKLVVKYSVEGNFNLVLTTALF